MEKIVLKLTKDEVLTKKTNEKIDCVSVEIFAETRPDEYLLFRDFKLKIPFSKTELIDVSDITKDDFNRFVLRGYCLPNAYTYGFQLLLDSIDEREKKGE